jgi:hypothetical protein
MSIDDVFVDIVQLHQMLEQLLIIYKATNKTSLEFLNKKFIVHLHQQIDQYVVLIPNQTISLYHLEFYQDLDQVLHLKNSKEMI